MKLFRAITCAMLLFSVTASTAQNKSNTVPRPKLVVGIVVDQMRWDYLYRYFDRYSENGFKRLLQHGFSCDQTLIDYLPTFTAPGHACIYTGSVPAFHGIVANDWLDVRTGKEWYCTEDTSVKSIGGSDAGLMSPRNMLASTITDELRLATNFRSRTFGVSIKDRGSILPAGHSASGAYWYDGKTGNFITSSFYSNELPAWVVAFNKRNLNDSLMQLDWNTIYPINTYAQSTADNNKYEGTTKGESAPVFPHRTSLSKSKGDIRSTPYGNSITRLMVQACIEGEQLGKGAFTDFLAVSFSSTDYVGHQYAPNSIEVEDTYLRFDADLAELLTYLDKQVGKGNYTVFLTADHGGAHNATFLTDNKIPAKSVTIKEVNKNLNVFLQQQFGNADLVISLMNYQVYLNEAAIADHKLDRERIRATIINWLRLQEGVTTVIDLEHPDKTNVPIYLQSRVNNGFYFKRSGSLQIIMDPAWYSGYAATGTTHGSWNPYDAHIPLIWYGWGIKKGKLNRTTYMTDIAATLAALLHIQAPNASIGQVITEVLTD